MISISLSSFLKEDAWAIDALYALRSRGKIEQQVINDFIDTGFSDYIDVISMIWQLPECYEMLKDNDEFNLSEIVCSDHLDTVIYAMRLFPSHMNMWVRFALWSAKQVINLIDDQYGINALNVASNYIDGISTKSERDDSSDLFRPCRNDGVYLSVEHATCIAVYDAIYASKLIDMGDSVASSVSDTVKRVVDAAIYADKSFAEKASSKLKEIINNGGRID